MNFKKVFLIAEIGINHNGQISIAKQLINLAKECGFDAVKFQKRNPKITTPTAKAGMYRDTPWGRITYLDYKEKIEFNEKQFDIINRHCKKVNMPWFASPWDLDSASFLKKYNLKYNKIASPMLTNLNLLNAVAKQKKPTFISTGMCKIKDIEKAIKIFKKHKCKYSILHCVSSYPAREIDLNLSLISTYKKKFKVEIGYSAHERSISPSLMAVCMGARIIERHITLDRSMWGTDQAASIEKDGMINLVTIIRKFEICKGDGIKIMLPDEKKKLEENKYW